MPTRSTLPSRMAWRAVATSSTLDACSTASDVASRTRPAKSRCGADGIPWIGITSVSLGSSAM